MKISRLFNSVRKRLAAGAIVALAIALHVAASAASTVKIEATTTVANATKDAGTNNWAATTTADYNDVVAVQVVYDNDEAADSGKVASNLRVKINIPTTAGTSQTVTSKTSADNSNAVTGSAKVTLAEAKEYLQYIPGTATWKHAATANGSRTVTQKVSDAVVTDPNGLVLENENPCQSGSIVIQARVMLPGVKIVKQSELLGKTNAWSANNTAQPGDTLKYMITYQNTGNTTQKNVVIRDNLPPNMTLVPGTTLTYTTTTPNGDPNPSNNITGGGINVGTYPSGAGAYVTFEVKIDDASKLACGGTVFRNVGVATPEGMNDYYNIAVTTVTKTCAETPVFSCDAFHVTVGDNKTVTVDTFKTTASNGATFKNVVIDWGDQSAALTTDKAVGQAHQYSNVGPYTLAATAHFTANGKDVSATNSCTQTVSFTTPTTPTPPTTPPVLPNTGAGNVIGIFAGVVAASTIGYRLFLSRKLARR